jgi:hypothetical protein
MERPQNPAPFKPWATDLLELGDLPQGERVLDVVLRQQGFEFFPDQTAGLQELKRVVVPGGRVLLSIWEGETPYSSAMAAAVEKHVGLEPATTLRTSRACPDPETVRGLMMQTGFRDARTCARDLTRRLPEIAHFVFRHLAATPVAGAIAALSEGKRAALADDAQGVTGVRGRRWNQLSRSRQRRDGHTVRSRNAKVHGRRTSEWTEPGARVARFSAHRDRRREDLGRFAVLRAPPLAVAR